MIFKIIQFVGKASAGDSSIGRGAVRERLVAGDNNLTLGPSPSP